MPQTCRINHWSVCAGRLAIDGAPTAYSPGNDPRVDINDGSASF